MKEDHRFHFFLGGQDLEMREIAALLEHTVPGQCDDDRLPWGAQASTYLARIEAALARQEIPVLVELADDLPPDLDRSRLVVVDHHGARAGHSVPTALEQVFTLLGLPASAWTRRMALVAANDRAHVAGLLAAGASREEMLALRAADRAAQGVSAQDEAEAHRAIAARVISGDLTETTTSSATSSAIADLMLPELGGPGYHALLVVMPGKLAAFADGAAILRLAASVPGSYWGGDLPHRGFWGTSGHDLPSALAAARAAMGTDRPAGTPT